VKPTAQKDSAQPAGRATLDASPAPAAAPFRRHVRHWKERFDGAGAFVWSRALTVNGKIVTAGSPVDKASLPAGRLRRLWHVGVVQRTDWAPHSAADQRARSA
jgi:hypothetical protein